MTFRYPNLLSRAVLLAAVALGFALGGCAVAPATDSNPLNKYYRCDRNGDLEQRQAC